jgi:hypothetical protein
MLEKLFDYYTYVVLTLIFCHLLFCVLSIVLFVQVEKISVLLRKYLQRSLKRLEQNDNIFNVATEVSWFNYLFWVLQHTIYRHKTTPRVAFYF